jgi:hypothetical protein
MLLDGLGKLKKNSMTSSGLEPATSTIYADPFKSQISFPFYLLRVYLAVVVYLCSVISKLHSSRVAELEK